MHTVLISYSKIIRRPFFVTLLFFLQSLTNLLVTSSVNNSYFYKKYFLVKTPFVLAFSNFDYYNSIKVRN